MRVRTGLVPVVVVSLLALGAFFVPQIASVAYLNLANASISRAVALPADAPDRTQEIMSAGLALDRSEAAGHSPRLDIARARLALAQGNAEMAASAFANEQAPDAMSEFIWGQAAWQAQETDSAIAHWRRAGAVEYFMQEAYRKGEAHDWRAAADLAWIASRIEPTSAQALYAWADAMSHQSKPTAQVFDALHRALDLTRDNEFRSTILSRQAELVSDQGDLKQALALFSQARSVAPIDARPRTGYALTILRLQPDSRSEAMALLEQVITDSPWYSAAYIALSEISESQGDGKDAEHWLQLGLDRNKNDARLLAPLGELYAREHRIAEARVEIGLALNYEIHADELQALARRLAELSTP